jgi:antitoxin component YwqK of YwqJK toxin-antitoxin module
MTRRVNIDDLEFEDTFVLDEDGKLFTGTSFENGPDGTLRAEQDWRLGRRDGMLREYSSSGRLLAEVPYKDGVLHGLGRWWHDNGQPAREKDVQAGTVLRRREWDEDGNLVDEYQLDANDELNQDVLKQKEPDAGG